MTLTLYVAEPASVPVIGASPPSWMCAFLLAEKALAHEVVPLSFARGEHRSPAMLARNPRGTIPVLVDGDAVVHETFAILLYVEHLVPGHLPADRADRARALTRFFEADALKSAGMTALAYLMRTDKRQRDPAVLATHGAALRAELARWEGYLGVAGYVCSDQLTLADIAVFPYHLRAAASQPQPPETAHMPGAPGGLLRFYHRQAAPVGNSVPAASC